MSKLMQSREVAAKLGISEQTVKKWRHEKKGPPFLKISGRLVRYEEQQVMCWLRSHCNQPTTA